MNFEKTSFVDNAKERKNSLYPERAFLKVDSEIARLKMIESGEIKKVELTEIEREEILEYEALLGEELERINDIKINSQIFYPEYFLTEKGRGEFFQATGLEMIGNDIEEIQRFILEKRLFFNLIDGKKLSELAGKSVTFNDEKITESIGKTMDENGEIRIDGLKNPSRVKIILNPAEALEKIQKLRQFKNKISLRNKNEIQAGSATITEIAKEKIKDLYRKKINVMIVNQVASGVWANESSSFLEDEQLTEEERKLKETVPGLLKFEEIYSRFDRFIYGAASEYDEDGMRKQLGKELLDYIKEIEDSYLHNQLRRDELIREKGLDPEKIKENNIDVETFSQWAEGLLDFYGEKSIHSAEEYDPKRSGSAADNKWQFVAREQYKSMAVNSNQKVIKSGTKNKSITEVLGTLLGHEFTHFIQAKNKQKLPLRLFGEKLGGFRSEVFAEGGAMDIENEVDKELFGYEGGSHPHYARAMSKKLEGGTYLDCVKAFYDSGLVGVKKKADFGIINKERFIEETKNLLTLAINRAKRLFTGEDRFDRSESYLTKSKDTVYAEQVIVMKKLKENGLEKCAFVSGVNLETLALLAEIGLIDLEAIEKPNLDFIRKIWDEERPEYIST